MRLLKLEASRGIAVKQIEGLGVSFVGERQRRARHSLL